MGVHYGSLMVENGENYDTTLLNLMGEPQNFDINMQGMFRE